jgi:hypothetical protein
MDDEDEDEDSEESRLLPSPSLVVLSTLRKETDERFIVGRWCDAGQCDGIMTDASSSSVVAALGVGRLDVIDGDAVRRRRMLLGILLLLLLLSLLAAGVATSSRGSLLAEASTSFVVVNDVGQCSFLWHDE